MDGADLVLNLAVDNDAPDIKTRRAKKGGRWTDRLKANRSLKRKTPQDHPTSNTISPSPHIHEPPITQTTKKPRLGRDEPTSGARDHVRSAPHVISSLFTHNPKIEAPVQNAVAKTPSKPSNAPLDDTSFASLGLDPLITAHLTSAMNLHKPTSIQRAVLSALLPKNVDGTANRDLFIQSETGSGKTLSFLLPIIQDLLPLSSLSYIDRSIGTLAIIIAPTRELAKQISDVLDALLKLRLRPTEQSGEADSSPRMTRWLVSGLLIGGATRTHEKARLRKGLPILVSTPGRLLDHLQNTTSFNVGKCRWLVLDEADRLMELGFEETIAGIIKGLNGRRRLAMQAVNEGSSAEVGGCDWERPRRTILCSATIRDDIRKLAGTVLQTPLIFKATNELSKESSTHAASLAELPSSAPAKFTPPSQLSQKYVIVPLKLRLVALVALLRTLLARSRRDSKIMVFMSCTDSVDYHWRLLCGAKMIGDESATPPDAEHTTEDHGGSAHVDPSSQIEKKSSLLPGASLFRLHGSLPTADRLESLRGFSARSKASKTPGISETSILLCTSVAARGLDLPLVRAVVQYDLPTEGGATEYVHRVGRTARAGKGGEAWSMVEPSEVEWVKWIEDRMKDDTVDRVGADDKRSLSLDPVTTESVLASGFGGKGTGYKERATEVQLAFERWVLSRAEHSELARKAYLSHMRAYATHPSTEKHIFHIRHLHFGHLAKAFALREAPTTVTARRTKTANRKRRIASGKDVSAKTSLRGSRHLGAEKRMEEVVRSQGRLLKKGGVMMSSGASEFQVISGETLETLVDKSPS